MPIGATLKGQLVDVVVAGDKWLGLTKAGGVEVTTSDDANYARRPIALVKDASGAFCSNTAAVAFAVPAAAADYWVEGLAVFDAVTGGNLVLSAPAGQRNVKQSLPVAVGPGGFKVSF